MSNADLEARCVRYVSKLDGKVKRLRGLLPFTVYGHRFAVTRVPWIPGVLCLRGERRRSYSITHLATGFRMGSLAAKTPEEAKREGIKKLHQIGRRKCLIGFKKCAKLPESLSQACRALVAAHGGTTND